MVYGVLLLCACCVCIVCLNAVVSFVNDALCDVV